MLWTKVACCTRKLCQCEETASSGSLSDGNAKSIRQDCHLQPKYSGPNNDGKPRWKGISHSPHTNEHTILWYPMQEAGLLWRPDHLPAWLPLIMANNISLSNKTQNSTRFVTHKSLVEPFIKGLCNNRNMPYQIHVAPFSITGFCTCLQLGFTAGLSKNVKHMQIVGHSLHMHVHEHTHTHTHARTHARMHAHSGGHHTVCVCINLRFIFVFFLILE